MLSKGEELAAAFQDCGHHRGIVVIESTTTFRFISNEFITVEISLLTLYTPACELRVHLGIIPGMPITIYFYISKNAIFS